MPNRRYVQREPTHDWQQIRPVILMGDAKGALGRNWHADALNLLQGQMSPQIWHHVSIRRKMFD